MAVLTRKMVEAGVRELPGELVEFFTAAAMEEIVRRIYRAMEDASENPGPKGQ